MPHRTSMVRRCFLVAGALLLMACQVQDAADSDGVAARVASSEEPGIEVEPDHTLYPRTMLVVPDTTPESDWLSIADAVRYDPGSGMLFIVDPLRGRVAEADTLGALVHLYGAGIGEGPHEVRELTDFSFSPSHVVFLDRGNRKVMVYPCGASRVDPLPVSTAYRSIALTPEETILVAPGIGAHAVDVYSTAGDLTGGIGEFEELPVRCAPDDDCERVRRMCLGCEVRVVGDVVLVMNTETDLLTIFGTEGRPTRSVDLRARIPRLREWIATDEPILARMQEDSDARPIGPGVVSVVFKSYFDNPHASPDGRLALSVNPAAPELRESGYQYWLLDVDTLEIESVMFGDPTLGTTATGWPTVFAAQRESYAIYRLQD